jgi:hypothetical protein
MSALDGIARQVNTPQGTHQKSACDNLPSIVEQGSSAIGTRRAPPTSDVADSSTTIIQVAIESPVPVYGVPSQSGQGPTDSGCNYDAKNKCQT